LSKKLLGDPRAGISTLKIPELLEVQKTGKGIIYNDFS